MKKIFIICLIASNSILSAQNNQLPDVKIKNINGSKVSASTISNNAAPMAIIFWSTTCHHTINGLDEIAELIADWEEEIKFKMIIVSTDDTRSSGKVPAFVNGKGWDFDCYLDENGGFRRALNVNNAPHILVLDSNYKTIFSQPTFNIGDEEVIYNHLESAQ